jgi:hypothetical protein
VEISKVQSRLSALVDSCHACVSGLSQLALTTASPGAVVSQRLTENISGLKVSGEFWL